MASPPIRLIIVVITLISFSALLAETPFDNTIPTLAMRIRGPDIAVKDITLELLCELSWLNFDAVNFSGRATNDYFQDLMSLCDSAGVYYSICPEEVMQYLKAWGDSTKYRYWFRNSDELLTSDLCFLRCGLNYTSLVDSSTAEAMYQDSVYSIKTTIVEELANVTKNYEFLWFYEVYDEAPAQQWWNALKDNNDPWDDYIPNVYTQARDDETGDTLTLEEVEDSGIFSIQKYYAENDSLNPVTFTLNFGLQHTIRMDEYTGLTEDVAWGSMADQATSVRAIAEAKYQEPPDGQTILPPVNNHPEFICFDYYPFRYVNTDSASAHSIVSKMCDDDWLFLVDHFEEGIDSTVIPALEEDVPVYYYPQTFGIAGGPAMYDTSGTLDYNSYRYRKPASQEFRMLCNLALLHQAKGIFPYNLCSYIEDPGNLAASGNAIMSSLLDRHNIPFDAPYEEWVYTGRWPEHDTYDYEYIRPDSIPPWVDGYDPLFEVEDYPILLAGDPKNREIRYEWLFGPYGVLYNDIGDILADVKWIGPEMHDLWWCSGGYSDGADISYDYNPIPADLITPVVKVFEDDTLESCYLFYTDRYCISNGNPYEITFSPSDLPEYADCSIRLLDHSRRFIMEGSYDSEDTVYMFLDTLDAGESRLVELIDPSESLPADVRITSPDVRMLLKDGRISVQMEATVGDSVDIIADFYNMGTESRENVVVTLYDSTAGQSIGQTEYLAFDGLPFKTPSACRNCDCSRASFNWTPDAADIGAHRLTVAAATWIGEPDSDDNSVDFVFLVKPRDYATEVRGNAWDMTEGGSNDWNTNDIEAVAQNWNISTGWTDSVSGMFEGLINYDIPTGWFKGDISLAIPEDSTKYIDTDKYHMLSFGITVNNPNRLDDNACAMHIRWIDSNNNEHGWVNLLNISDSHVGNGWDRWTVIGPIDLKADTSLHWGDDDASDLQMRFQSNVQYFPVPPDLPDSINVRIGWIRLEESAQ